MHVLRAQSHSQTEAVVPCVMWATIPTLQRGAFVLSVLRVQKQRLIRTVATSALFRHFLMPRLASLVLCAPQAHQWML